MAERAKQDEADQRTRRLSRGPAVMQLTDAAGQEAGTAYQPISPEHIALALADRDYDLEPAVPARATLEAAIHRLDEVDPPYTEEQRRADYQELLRGAAEIAVERRHDEITVDDLWVALRSQPGRTARLFEVAQLGAWADQDAVKQPPEPAAALETVPTHADRPAEVDRLGRRRFAEVIAERMRRLRGERTDVSMWTRRHAPRGPAEEGAFLVHLHAPWGAGKTSLLNFVKAELHAPEDGSLERWIVVDFSAWRHQRVPPPWWWLLAAIRTDGLHSLRRISRARAAWFWTRDLLWRLWNARAAWVPLAIAAALAGIAAATDLFGFAGEPLSAIDVTAGAIAALIALAVTTWGLIRGVSRWLLLGSAPAAARVLQRVHDPLHMIRRRFRFLIRGLRRPVAVFVDDLDRCRSDYVIELLEGIQTLFLEQPVVYVVAADRRWVCESYAHAYREYCDTVGQPGRPLGYLFLEKTFQLSIELPPIGPTEQESFWRALVGEADDGGPAEPVAPEDEIEPGLDDRRRDVARQAFGHLTTETEVLRTLDELTQDPPVRGEPGDELFGLDPEELRRAAVRRLGSDELQRDVEHMLVEFYPLVENNPRAMKRLVNAYGLERARQVREGTVLSEDARRRLVLWTIVKLRWPVLAERLEADPALVDAIRDPDAARRPVSEAELVGDRAVRAVFEGIGGVALGVDDVRAMASGVAATRSAVGA